jgi:hypothetical protein
MTILSGDIKIVASETMLDVDEGGGAPTAIVVTDGASNAIFQDISELDRAGGDVSLRKVFVTVQTENTDTYLGSNVILADPPDDPRVSVALFSTASTFDSRQDAQDRIESYLAPGPEWNGYLLENHIAGQSSIRLFQRVGTEPPTIGRTLILVYNEGVTGEREQYVRVTDVSSEEQEFTYMSGASPVEFVAQVVTCNLSDALRLDFPGSAPSRLFSRETNKTKLRDTVVADAARYYGVSPLTEAVETGDVSARVDSIYTQIVPSAQTEIPLVNQNAGDGMDTLVESGDGNVSFVTTNPIGAGTALATSNPITPGTLTITYSGGVLTDDGGQLYSGADVVGTVDYPRGTVTMASGAPTISGSKTVSFRPAAYPLILADTAMIAVTQESRAFNYIYTVETPPAPGTLMVSYRANGRWYDLNDNGAGVLRGADAAYGAGTVSFSTGTVAVTLGVLPDVDSGILFAWGARTNYLDRSDFTVPAPRFNISLAETGIAPGSVTITWNDGSPRTATDDGAGAITGDATGEVNYNNGEITITRATLPLGGQEYEVEYGWSVPSLLEASNPPGTVDLGETDITPGSLEVEWEVSGPQLTFGGVFYMFDGVSKAYDDGAGLIKLRATGATVGSIDYDTGMITGLTLGRTMSVPVMKYTTTVRISAGAIGLGAPTAVNLGMASYVPSHVEYESRALTINPAYPVKFRFRHTDTTTVETQTFTQDAVEFDLTDKFAENIVPGSVAFTLGGRTYFDKAGAIHYGLEVTTGASTLAGSINYASGAISLTSWVPSASSAVALLSLATTLEGKPVTVATFRVPVAPLRPSSLQILATKLSGGSINVSANNAGELDAAGVRGHVNYETGVVQLQFGDFVTAAGEEAEDWYDEDNVVGSEVWKPEPVFADTLRYNAVAYTYLPLDADILGLDPVRLPQDGRVPIFRVGGFVVIGHTDTTTPAVAVNAGVVDCGRVRLSRVRVLGNNDVAIETGFTADLEAGTVTFTNVTGYSQPVRVEHRIEDMLQVSDVQITGDMSFTRPVTHDFPADETMVSSALVTNDLRARTQLVFDQLSWDGSTWSDAVTGSAAVATYSTLNGPITVTNKGAVTERWIFQFTSTTAGRIIGEHLGVIGEFSINTTTAPLNPATGVPYLSIPAGTGWGIGWVSGNILRVNTIGAEVPVWLVRTVQQGPETEDDHTFTLLVRGDVDAP